MKKKFLLTSSAVIATAAILGLASCTKSDEDIAKREARKRSNNAQSDATYHFVEAPAAESYSTDAGRVDVFLNYQGTSGVTRKESDANLKDPVTGAQMTADTLLPTWVAFQSYTKTEIKEASNYIKNTDDTTWESFTSDTIMSEKDPSQYVDLVYNTTGNFKTGVSKLASLNEFINVENPDQAVMKNFSAYLKKNPAIKKLLEIGSNGEIYYTPYFDGVDDIERMFVMDTALTKTVLDNPNNRNYDETTTNGGQTPDGNVLQGGFYQPFMDSEKNYADENQKVTVVFEGAAYQVKVVQTTNIIKQQNDLLKDGCTGKQLAEQFISYIQTAYANFFDADKNEDGIVFYEKPSDLFLTDSAAFNTDDLIALMRVVKANPGMITGDPLAEITTFFPRATTANRIENILDFAQVWGIQGLDGENKNYYFGSDGKCHTLESTQQSYDALQYMSELYDEHLILQEFWAQTGNASTGQLDKYFKKKTDDAAYGFMMYDFSAATTAANDLVDGVGTPSTSRLNGFETDYECKGITPIIAPLTYWATESNWDHDSAITNRTGKTLTRYYESNRAMKGNSWAIPKDSDNKAGAARLMDFMFSDLGQIVNNYGPTAYWAAPRADKDTVEGEYDSTKAYVSDDLVLDEKNPIISTAVKLGLVGAGKDYWTYSREVLGSTHGVGNVRPAGVNLQVTNAYGQVGVKNIQNAFTVGNNGITGNGVALKLATFTKEYEDDGSTKFTWNTCVPSGYAEAPKDSSNEWTAVSGFWAAKAGQNKNWVSAVSKGHDADISTVQILAGSADATWTDLQNQLNVFNKKYLRQYVNSIGEKYIPDYAKISA